MAENRPDREFVDMLLEQEPLPEASRYSQHRRQIDERLRKALRDERIVRVATLVVWAVACGLPLLMMGLQHWVPRERAVETGPISNVLMPLVVITLFVCSALAIPLLLVYVLRYRRAVDRARDDARDVVLLELQQKVAELSKGTRPPAE